MTGPVVPETDSRLDQLCAEFARLKPVTDEKNERLKQVTEAIKAELAAQRPGESRVTLASPRLETAYRLTAKESMRLDTARMKKEEPFTYAKFAKKSTSWEFRAA